jgi:hypothetical protein
MPYCSGNVGNHHLGRCASLEGAMIYALIVAVIIGYLYCLHRLTSAERHRQYRLWVEAEASRRAILAAKRFNEANQHRDGSGEWKDWA